MTAALSCRSVTVRHEAGQPAILSDLSLSLAADERVGLAGLNGAGKTTLLMALAGLVPHRGEITICGERLVAESLARLRRRIGFLFNVPEDQLLFPKVVEDVEFALLQAGCDRKTARERALAVLERLGMAAMAEDPLHHLSHGQKQRIALAGAIVADPPLLLLDEPTAGLDPRGRQDLAALLVSLNSAQLIATHDLDFAERVCDRVLLLEGGSIAATDGRAADIRARWGLAGNGSG